MVRSRSKGGQKLDRVYLDELGVKVTAFGVLPGKKPQISQIETRKFGEGIM